MSTCLASYVTNILCSFLALSVSPVFTIKAGLSILKANCVLSVKMFLKAIVTLDPGLMLNGPCGFGARQCPCKGMKYSPPLLDDIVRVAEVSPNCEGSKLTSTVASVPLLPADATVMFLST